MSILHDLMKYRNYKCNICGSKETFVNKRGHKQWYKTRIVGEAGFWCDGCYKNIYRQMKNHGNKNKEKEIT